MNAKLMLVTGAVLGLGMLGATQTAKAGGLALNISIGAPRQAVIVQQPVCAPVVQQQVVYQQAYQVPVQQTVVYQQAPQVVYQQVPQVVYQQVPQTVVYEQYPVAQPVIVQDQCAPVIVREPLAIYRPDGRFARQDFRHDQVDVRFGFRR